MAAVGHRTLFLNSMERSNYPRNIRGLCSDTAPEEATTLQVWSCRECLVPLAKAGAEGDDVHSDRSCALFEEVRRQVKELWEEGDT